MRGRLAQEAGLTLVELMLTAVTMLLILGAVLSVFDTTNRVAHEDLERANIIAETRAGVLRMTREIREAYRLNDGSAAPAGVSNGYQVDVSVQVLGANRRVRYRCDVPHPTEATFRRCTRSVLNGTTWGPEVVVIDKIANTTSGASPSGVECTPVAAPVFTYNPANSSSPTTDQLAGTKQIRISVQAPARGGRKGTLQHCVVLSDGVYLRNRDV